MSLVTVIAASSQPAGGTPAEPSAIVSGAGTVAVNGTYTYRGTNDDSGEGDFPYYNLAGEPDNVGLSSIWYEGGGYWNLTSSGGDVFYLTNGNGGTNPWIGTWVVNGGDPPAPTVTEG